MQRPFRHLLALLPTVAARDVVSFDFGWKHRTGLHDWAAPDARPPKNPDPGSAPAEAQPVYDDSTWADVQLPHDGLIANRASLRACPGGCSGKSYLPRHVLWYRKSFTLPAHWNGSLIYVDFEGSFRDTTVWVNGARVAYHSCGYTPFRVRLDNLTALRVGASSDATPNVLSVFVDPDNGAEGARTHGSGWWYEGGGLYRSAHLVRTDVVHLEQDGLFAYSNLSWSSATSAPPAALPGSVQDVKDDVEAADTTTTDAPVKAVLHASAAVANGGSAAAHVCVALHLAAPDGTAAASPVMSAPQLVPPGASAVLRFNVSVGAPKLWSAASPALYTVSAAVHTADGGVADGGCSAASPTLDALSVEHGFRSLRYDADEGFFLNRKHFKVRGFCDHNTFAVVGMAVPERVNLYRAQASRAIGGNGRRTSHNPPATSMLQIYDRIGVVVMDENRLFANDSAYVANMAALVKRDRNHPSVVIWSFCNENGCEGARETGGPGFYDVAYKFDGSRPTLANMFTFGDLLSNTIDVQGFSHQTRDKLERCHARLPQKPIYMSECCSCNTFRDEDDGCETLHDNPHTPCIQKSFNARCAEANFSTNASDAVPWAVGTMVWTLFDYYGEPPVGGLEVSSSYGQYDLCGFAKAAAFWYRTQWLLAQHDGQPDKPFKTGGKHEAHIVESWESPDAFPSSRGKGTRQVHVYTSAPTVELLVNGVPHGSRRVTRMVEGPGSYAEFEAVPWAHGNVTAVAKDASGKAVASAARHTNGAPAGLTLTIDAPSAATGTGTALLLDGQDCALLRASVVDAAGRVVHLASHNVSFRVVSGPGRVQGAHNGDTHSHLRNDSPWYPAYHGLVRAVIRVTSTAGRAKAERALLAQIDVHGPHGRRAAREDAMDEVVGPIVVEARTDGLPPAQVHILTSTDAKEAVLPVAKAGAGMPVDFFGNGDQDH